jgi:diguanylate cyclase (GGDEF)-like protein
MLEQSFFQLLSPLIFLVFSGGFLLLWRIARDIRSLRFFAASYLFGACAMIFGFLRVALPQEVSANAVSLLYMATTIAFCAGLHTHYGGRVPWKGMGVFALAVFAAFSLARYRTETIVLPTWILNTGIIAFYVHALVGLRKRMRRGIDRILQAVVAVSAFMVLARTAVVFWYTGDSISEATYASSLASVTIQLIVAVAALATAGVLFVMFGMEILSRLTETSETDPLTGILNRRGFEARIAKIADDGPAAGTAHAVVMADIDRFKAVNDSHGHEAGDAVIKAFARVLCEAAREGDHVVRWGGEEFLVVVANADTATARLYAEAVRSRLEQIAHDDLGGASVTASFGVAGWRHGQDLSGASRDADAALYQAKNEGRNRVCVHKAKAAEERPDAAVA